MADLIVRAGQPGSDDAERTGLKMARLAELGHAGLVKLEWFVVTTEAYERHMAVTGLGARVNDLLGQWDGRDPAEVAGRIREAFGSVPVEAGVAEAIAAGYAGLRGGREPRVAVRSSACDEDSAAASFAGVFETILGVSGAAAVTEAVRSCWASLFDVRALAYRRDHRDARMAVGVVELVPARSSGVAFSVHPRSGRRDRVVIEATWGWGHALVAGLVVPDRVEVDRDDRRVLRRDVASKDIISAFDEAAGRVAEKPMPPGLRQAAVLDDAEIGQIVAAVLAVEEHYGHPVDVEWVLDRSGRPPWIVQARPVTGLPREEPVTGWDPVHHAFGAGA